MDNTYLVHVFYNIIFFYSHVPIHQNITLFIIALNVTKTFCQFSYLGRITAWFDKEMKMTNEPVGFV